MIIGIRNRLSRLVTRRGLSGQTMQVWITPSPAQWEYIPQPPYTLIRFDNEKPLAEAAIYAWVDGLNDGQLCCEFLTNHMPRIRQTCMVIDDRHQIVLGWIWSENDGPLWKGCEFMYKGLEVAGNPVDAALWCAMARRNTIYDFPTMEDYR